MSTIDNTQDLLDIRDIIERIELLESGRDDYVDTIHWAASYPEDAIELRTLTALAADCKNRGGDEQWRVEWYPITLIRESYFEHAMDDMVADCYGDEYTKNLPSFMTLTLDYDALKSDYTTVDFDGVTYYVR